ncbi:MAG: hypothetical protein LBT40_15660 [Deltaproteobacteria bacterium]|jgi:hypothetical protein|nr:hypothetical protein [Deltaproteobacteria bacterium]
MLLSSFISPARPAGAAVRLALASFLAVWLLSPPQLSAQQVDPSLFEGQAPVTKADVPAALAAMREMGKDDMDPARMAAIAGENGITEERLAFLIIKFLSGAALLSPNGPTTSEVAAQMGSPLAVPTPDELEVIRGVYDQIVEVLKN